MPGVLILMLPCSGFIFSLATGASFIESGRYKKVVIVAADMMSSITDYTDRSSCPLFGDGAAAVLLEPATGDEGIQDYINHTDGKGRNYLLCEIRRIKTSGLG